jgi:hypothetical protein
MRINTTMPSQLNKFFQKELAQAETLFEQDNFFQSWQHLERAHILGQPYPYHHSLVHWRMLLFGIKTKNTREIIGQVPRLLVGGVKSFVGVVPVGNTGGANVPPLQAMPIPDELQKIIEQSRN